MWANGRKKGEGGIEWGGSGDSIKGYIQRREGIKMCTDFLLFYKENSKCKCNILFAYV